MTEYVKYHVGDYTHYGVVVNKTEYFVEFRSNLVGGKFSIPHNDADLVYINEDEYNTGVQEVQQIVEPVESVVTTKQPKSTSGKKTVKDQVLEILQQHPNKTKKELVQIIVSTMNVAENTANMYLYKAKK